MSGFLQLKNCTGIILLTIAIVALDLGKRLWKKSTKNKNRDLSTEVFENVIIPFYQQEESSPLLFLPGHPVSVLPPPFSWDLEDVGIGGSYWCEEFLHSLQRVT